MTRVLIIGEAPSKNEPDPKPIEGRIGHRLAAYAGLTFEEFLARTERVNLLDVRQDTAEKGFTFDHTKAVEQARKIIASLEPNRHVILLGKRVARAVGCMKDYFEPCHLENNITLYVVPHPSGINRWYNDPANQNMMERFMHAAAVDFNIKYMIDRIPVK